MNLGLSMVLNRSKFARTAVLGAVALRIETSKTGVSIARQESGHTGTARIAARFISIQDRRRNRLGLLIPRITRTADRTLI